MNRQREEKVNRKMKERLAEKIRAKGEAKYIPKIKITPQEPPYIFPDFKFIFAGIGMPEENEAPELPGYILEKANELGSRITRHAVFSRPWVASWYPHDNHISLPSKGSIKYLGLLALHELGHAATTPRDCPDVWDDLPENVITDEARAWKWARDNSPAWTPAMERYSRRCLRAYVNAFGCAELIDEIYPREVKA